MKQFVMFVGVAVVVLVCGGMSSAAARTTGSFVLEQVDPKAGDSISFKVDVKNLPTNGGATISPWVELACGNVYESVAAANSVVVQGTSNPTRAFFTLSSPEWSTAGFSEQSCEAYLFYDGWNGPRRRKTNTLAALFFSAAAAP